MLKGLNDNRLISHVTPIGTTPQKNRKLKFEINFKTALGAAPPKPAAASQKADAKAKPPAGQKPPPPPAKTGEAKQPTTTASKPTKGAS